MKWHIDFGIGKARFISFDRSYNSGAIDMKTDWSLLEKVFFKMSRLCSSSIVTWG